jgi:hypothetical protein
MLQARQHFLRGLVGEGEQEDLARLHALGEQVGHAIGERARLRAAKGLPYQLQIPWDATKTWSPEFISYWKNFGSRIGQPARALPVPETTPELKMRALDIRSKTVQLIRPIDMNVVFQQDVLSDENKFDLVIGTNVFVYYGGFEQALALRNLAGMMRNGGMLLSNNFLQIFPVCPNPPSLLTVSFNSVTGCHSTFSTRLTTICAIRSPG